jgi:hypothetical protein
VDQIIAYESGLMDEDETVEFFQQLVDTGLAWTLQGSYGRAAAALIDAGLVHVSLEGETVRQNVAMSDAGVAPGASMV